MKYFTYILKSKVKDRFYVGSCKNLKLRLERHNTGNTRSTKAFLPWEVVYFEQYENKQEAIKREHNIKGQKSKRFLENLIGSGGRPD